jgi:MYXO-CTERM domain-containing protein
MRNLNMNKLTFTISAAMVSSLFAVGSASADLQGLSYDNVENGMAGLTTWRIYANIDDGELDAVYGDSENALLVNSDNGFYQNQFGGYGTPSESLFAFFPSLEFDSFVTIGLLNDTGDAMMDIGIDWSDFEDNGGAISTDNGTWFATPDEPQVQDVDGRVLVGQFTVGDDDHVFGTLNFQGKEAGTLENWNALGVNFDTVPAPGAIALLGLAGIAARRRRK